MPASQSGFGNFYLERNLSMPAGYPGIPVLGLPLQQQQQQQQQQQLAAMAAAGLPVTYPGLQGYSFIPYTHHRPIAHMNAFDLKAASPYHHHHHALLARSAAFFPSYRSGGLEDAGRVAKVATRESTGALKAWLNEHLKNPYPTKGEKIMLAIITKMSLTQVSTWFANARRRLKKENRVSWASRSKSDEEYEEEEEEEAEEEEEERADVESEEESVRQGREADDQQPRTDAAEPAEGSRGVEAAVEARLEKVEEEEEPRAEEEEPRAEDSAAAASRPQSKDDGQKPKIWSLAETATSQSVSRPTDGVQQQAGKLWAEWVSRNGLLVAPRYTSHNLP